MAKPDMITDETDKLLLGLALKCSQHELDQIRHGERNDYSEELMSAFAELYDKYDKTIIGLARLIKRIETRR